jgi:hypothetical protein
MTALFYSVTVVGASNPTLALLFKVFQVRLFVRRTGKCVTLFDHRRNYHNQSIRLNIVNFL